MTTLRPELEGIRFARGCLIAAGLTFPVWITAVSLWWWTR